MKQRLDWLSISWLCISWLCISWLCVSWLIPALVGLALTALASPAAADEGELLFSQCELPSVQASPPPPPPSVFPVQLILDDDQAEGNVGAGLGTAEQFLWFNQFTAVPADGFFLAEVWVLFQPGANMAVGAPIQLTVYHDPDGDPQNGADLLQSYDVAIQELDGDTFSIYELAEPLLVPGGGDVLIGAIPRFIQSGVTSLTTPAAIDSTASSEQSWIATWSATTPLDGIDPPDLATAESIAPIDSFVPGNWMIRGFGTPVAGTQPVIEVPMLDGIGLGFLVVLLSAGGVFFLRRRSVSQDAGTSRRRLER